MSATVLVKALEEEAKLEGPVQGVRIVSVSSKIDNLMVIGSRVGSGRSGGQFEFEVGMTETARSKDSLSMNFALKFGKSSTGQVSTVKGRAVLKFANFNPDTDLTSLGGDIDNEMAIEIFRSNYQAIYLLHESLGMETPSPWVTQDVSLSSREHSDLQNAGNL